MTFIFLRELVDLQYLGTRLLCFPFPHLVDDVRGQMILKKSVLHAGKCILYCLRLRDDIDAVLFVLYHSFDAPKLPLDDR